MLAIEEQSREQGDEYVWMLRLRDVPARSAWSTEFANPSINEEGQPAFIQPLAKPGAIAVV